MIITKLEQRDIPGCREIYNYYVKNTSFSLEETEQTADQYEARVAGVTERFPFLVARDDAGNVAGFAYLSDFNPRSGYRHTADLSIYTAPDLRGVGLGAALLAAIEAEGRKMGITNLISIITDENAASCRFHEKNGFVKEGHLHDIAVKFGRRCGVCYYRKELGYNFLPGRAECDILRKTAREGK